MRPENGANRRPTTKTEQKREVTPGMGAQREQIDGYGTMNSILSTSIRPAAYKGFLYGPRDQTTGKAYLQTGKERGNKYCNTVGALPQPKRTGLSLRWKDLGKSLKHSVAALVGSHVNKISPRHSSQQEDKQMKDVALEDHSTRLGDQIAIPRNAVELDRNNDELKLFFGIPLPHNMHDGQHTTSTTSVRSLGGANGPFNDLQLSRDPTTFTSFPAFPESGRSTLEHSELSTCPVIDKPLPKPPKRIAAKLKRKSVFDVFPEQK